MLPARHDRQSPRQPSEAAGEGSGLTSERDADFIRHLTGVQSSLRAYILALLGGQKKEADDILQDTNVAIWEKRNEYDHTREFIPWAIAFAYHKVRAYRRDSARSRLVFSDEIVAEIHNHLEQSLLDASAMQDQLRLCLEKLNADEHDLIHKRYHARTSVVSLAESINKSAGSVARRLFRIREKLRSCIQIGLAQSRHQG